MSVYSLGSFINPAKITSSDTDELDDFDSDKIDKQLLRSNGDKQLTGTEQDARGTLLAFVRSLVLKCAKQAGKHAFKCWRYPNQLDPLPRKVGIWRPLGGRHDSRLIGIVLGVNRAMPLGIAPVMTAKNRKSKIENTFFLYYTPY